MFKTRYRSPQGLRRGVETVLMNALRPGMLLLTAIPAYAQRLTGIVRGEPHGQALPAAVVMLTDSSGRTVARTVTDHGGSFSIIWHPLATRLHGIRMGYRPVGHQLVGLPRDTQIVVTLGRLVRPLSPVKVSRPAVCSESPERREALQLWEQARAGLLATVVAREEEPPHVTVLRYERALDPHGRFARPRQVTEYGGKSTRPFHAARSEEELAQHGYVDRPERPRVFFAPDADVLLHDSFAATHCFGIRSADSRHDGMLGLTFAPLPTNRRGVPVDVSGTLWIQPSLPKLEELEFSYTGLDAAAMQSAGGRIHFQLMDSGLSIISSWSIVLPVVTDDPFRKGTRILVELVETGGLVVTAEWSHGAQWDSGLRPITGQVTERGTKAQRANVLVTIEGLSDSVSTDSTGSFHLFVVPPGRYTVVAIDTTLSDRYKARVTKREINVVLGRKPSLSLELPSPGRADRRR